MPLRIPSATLRYGIGYLNPTCLHLFWHRNSSACHIVHVPAFSPVGMGLLCRLLTSAGSSPRLTTTVAQGKPAALRVRRAIFTLMPATYTSTPSVQVSGFEDICFLTRCDRLICDSCSSGQCFAYSFLQILPRGRHPCRSVSRSPCRTPGTGGTPQLNLRKFGRR